MDSSDSGILAIIGLLLSLGSTILAVINHKRIKSKCCGHNADISIDIEDTTPTKKDTYKAPVIETQRTPTATE
jgi:hypothetical protein